MSDRDIQKDRLIELIKKGVDISRNVTGLFSWGDVADYLLANGVIVLPCEIGQTVYTRYGYSFKIQRIEVLEDKKIIFRCGNDGTDDYMAFYDFEIGTDVFLTEEEAEKALKERNKGNET